MSTKVARFLCAATANAIAVLVVHPTGAATTYRERVQERTLGNGLELILLEDHKAPVAVLQLWYRVGSRNESPGFTGLSHLLEHMMFRGTEKVGPEEYSKIVQRNGGQTNAFTTQDYTTYFATIASDRLEVVIELEADRMANLVINEALYGPERMVVMEERRLRVDNSPVGALVEQLSATAYLAHPYQYPTIGWMTDIRQSTVADLVRHYKTYYVPNNAFVVAVGDFDSEQLVAAVEAAFGKIPAASMPPSVRGVEPIQAGERRVELHREAELPFVGVAYHVPNLGSRDGAALEVMAQVLAGGESTRLHHELVYKRRLARQAAARYDYTSVDPGLFIAYAQPLPDRSASDVEAALIEQIDKLKEEPPTAKELEKARNAIEAGFVFAQDSLFYQGMLLGEYEVAGDWRRIDEYLPAIRAVTTEDLIRVARVYFDEVQRTVATLEPLPPTDGRAPLDSPPSGLVN
jgi:zinc protease